MPDRFHVSTDPRDLAHASERHASRLRHGVMIKVALAVFVVAGVLVYLS